jgi:ribosome recycling factor
MINYQTIIQNQNAQIEKIIEYFSQELKTIRTGKANPALVEDLQVSYYGQMMPIKQTAAISCPEPRQIYIQPWDKSMINVISKAISESELGVSPSVDQNGIRINLPALTEEFRKNLAIQVGREKETVREEIRKWRDELLKEIQNKFNEKEISEDDKFKAKDDIQEVVDKYNKKIDELAERKTKEIMEI